MEDNMDEKEKCIDCFYFKTKVINKRNFNQLKFESLGKIRQALKERREVRIFWCIFARTPNEVYIENNPRKCGLPSTALTMEVNGCKMRSI